MYKINYRFKRFRVMWRRWKRTLDNNIKPESSKLTPYEEKGLRLWKICLKDEETQMSYNSYGVSQIEKDNIFIILSPISNNHDRHTMTIMDITDDRRSLYELNFDGKSSKSSLDAFDVEMEKRMLKVENSKRDLIETDIDKLIANEERIIFRKLKEKEAKKNLDSVDKKNIF